jgi:hypothetical protein
MLSRRWSKRDQVAALLGAFATVALELTEEQRVIHNLHEKREKKKKKKRGKKKEATMETKSVRDATGPSDRNHLVVPELAAPSGSVGGEAIGTIFPALVLVRRRVSGIGIPRLRVRRRCSIALS